MKKYAESKGFFDFKAEREELYSIVKAWWECSSQYVMDRQWSERMLLPQNWKNVNQVNEERSKLLPKNCKNRKQVNEYNRNCYPKIGKM